MRTDWRASPTGFPFKVVQLPGTLADEEVYAARRAPVRPRRAADPYRKPDGAVGYRCPAEPVAIYQGHGGGREANTVGRRCLCNGLMAAAGFAQRRAHGYTEPAVITAGTDFTGVRDLLRRLPDGRRPTAPPTWWRTCSARRRSTAMTVLVAYGTTGGSTAEIAGWIAEELRTAGLDVRLLAAGAVDDVAGYEALVLGAAMYAAGWHADARKFAKRFAGRFAGRPVWLFSSGPLDHTAEDTDLPPNHQAEVAMRAAAGAGACDVRRPADRGGARLARLRGPPDGRRATPATSATRSGSGRGRAASPTKSTRRAGRREPPVRGDHIGIISGCGPCVAECTT